MGNEIITSVSTIIVALSAMTTTCIAYAGLNSWKKQHKAKISHELARDLLRSFYHLRDDIKSLRSPFVSYIPASENEFPDSSQEQRNFIGYKNYYQNLVDNITHSTREVYSKLLMAEVLFGPEIRKQSDELIRLKKELIEKLDYHLEIKNPANTEDQKEIPREMFKAYKFNLHISGKEDQFQSDFEKQLKIIETILNKQ